MGSGFLALGDSYTIGEGVNPADCWPAQLTRILRQRGIDLQGITILARTGWTTFELAEGIAQASLQTPYELVSLQVGVNNQYRSLSLRAYRVEFQQLLDQSIGFAGGEAGRGFVLSIPDWGVTPFADGRDSNRIAAEIDDFNHINRSICTAGEVKYVDLTAISRSLGAKPAMLAEDGLHPSSIQYAAWVELILPQALKALSVSA